MDPRQASEQDIEIWLPVVGYEDRYQVSNTGRVRSKKQILKASPGKKNGYPLVSFWQKDVKKMCTYQVHRLVLDAFDGPRKTSGCRHLNGVRTCNLLHNLMWGSSQENHDDSKLHGTASKPPLLVQVGEANHSVKLTEKQVLYIRQRTKNAKALAAELGVTQWTIFDIRKGRSWTHI